MPLINLSFEHGRTVSEARSGLEKAVSDLQGTLGRLIRRVEWGADRDRVRIDGAGFWVEMSVDDRHVHANGDIPMIAGLLGRGLTDGIEQALRARFPKKLT